MKEKTLYKNAYLITYWSVFVFISVILFWKARYGYANLDEAFYLTIPYRFLQGDKIIFDEWSNTQLSAFPLLPILSLYIKLNGTKGIYLFIRYLYTIFKCFISLFIYYKLRKYNQTGAMLTSICFLVFAAYGLMVLSYNSMAIGGLICALLLLLTETENKSYKMSALLGGICLSIAVLGLPHLAVLYILYGVSVLFCSLVKTKIKKSWMKNFFAPSKFLWFSLGIFIMISVFSVYVLKNTSFSEIRQSLPYILNGDPNHPPKELRGIFWGYTYRIFHRNDNNIYTCRIYKLFAVELILMLLDRRRHVNVHALILSILTIILQVLYFSMDGYINYMVYVPNVLALFLIILLDNPKIRELFFCIWIPGLLYTVLEYIASNTGFMGIASASCVAMIGSIMIISIAGIELITKIKCRTIILSVILITICTTLYFRITYIFWEDGIQAQTEYLSEGPQAGLLVSTEKYYSLHW